MICFPVRAFLCETAFLFFQRENETRYDENERRFRAKLRCCRKCLAMFGASLVVRLACLLWLVFSRALSFDRTWIYNNRLRPGQLGRTSTYRRNAPYAGLLRTNRYWHPKTNHMALSYTRANQRWTKSKRVRFGNVEGAIFCFVMFEVNIK